MGDRADIDYAEERTGHKLSRTHFMSLEGAHHSHGNYPIFWVAKPGDRGEHIKIAQFEGDFYLAKATGKPVKKPIEYIESGKSER